MKRQRFDRPTSRRGATNGWLIVILLILTLLLAFQMRDTVTRSLFNPNATARPITARGNLAEDELATIELFQSASASVVHITSVAVTRNRLSLNIDEIPQGTGSGIIWDEDGHIVTNYHVIKDANEFMVTLSDDTTYDARPVGDHADKDLAVLKIDAPRSKLSKISIGSSADLQVGQKVFAIGNPFGLDQTLTSGVISGLDRQIRSVSLRPIRGVIQTDAAINPGNSGGPLLDSAGRLIGVNTAIYSPSGAYAGIGFAVPVDVVNIIVPQLIRNGNVERPGIGIQLGSDSIVQRLVSQGRLPQPGVIVLKLVPGGAAEAAGLRESTETSGRVVWGDLIIAIDGAPVQQSTDLFSALTDRKVGDEVLVTILRDGQQMEIPVRLQALPTDSP